jgi:cathepsin L
MDECFTVNYSIDYVHYLLEDIYTISRMMFIALLICVAYELALGRDERSFLAHMRENSLSYMGKEYHFRLGIYLNNNRRVKEFNRQTKTSFRLGMNNLATLTPAEYRVLLGYKVARTDQLRRGHALIVKDKKIGAPTSWDWRAEGKVYDVKDQGDCGSCWAFGAIGAQESMYAIYTNGVPEGLSEQNLVDCDTEDYGCDGGNALNAWDYVLFYQSGNFVSQASYPYKATGGTCQYNDAKKDTYLIDYGWLARPDENNLLDVVYEYGPVACAIDATWDTFNLYDGGVYNEPRCSSNDLDHEVLTVGYGSEIAGDY